MFAAPQAAPVLSPTHERHEPHTSVLYQTVQSELKSFLSLLCSPLPPHVIKELYAYLRCGILAHGFVRTQCLACKFERLTAFSCKKRGFCPSCGARRMNEFGIHLIDQVLPFAPYRQWVLSLPFPIRFLLAYDPDLITKVLEIFQRAISSWYISKIKKILRNKPYRVQTGAITAVQRFGSALNLNVHFHSVFLDGTYVQFGRNARPVFFRVFPPSDEEVSDLVQKTAKRITRYFLRHGYLDDRGYLDHDSAICNDSISQCFSASIFSKAAFGPRKNQKTRKFGTIAFLAGGGPGGPRCAAANGFSLHANVSMQSTQRKALETLLGYIARPPIALDRLERLPDGNILYRFKQRFSDGTSHVVFEPMELLEKIVALIPPARKNLLRYHGAFAPNAEIRPLIAPGRPLGKDKKKCSHKQRMSWAELQKRVFNYDLSACPKCGHQMKLISVIMHKEIVRKILDHVGLPSEPPMIHPARAPPQHEFEMGDAIY